MNKIIIQDNFLTKIECEKLIKFYESKEQPLIFDTTYPLLLEKNKHKSLVKKINKVGMSINKSIIDWFEIVKWPFPNKGKNLHLDLASNETILSAIIYLNNDFKGGYTWFKDTTHIAPVVGRAIFFDGTKYPHGVSIIDEGIRYTIAIWFKKNK